MARFTNKPLKETGQGGVEDKLKKYARKHEVKVNKFQSMSTRSVPDDIFLFANGTVVFIECKSPGKFLSQKQRIEAQKIIDRNGNYFVVDNIGHPELSRIKDAIVVCSDGYTLIDRILAWDSKHKHLNLLNPMLDLGILNEPINNIKEVHELVENTNAKRI